MVMLPISQTIKLFLNVLKQKDYTKSYANRLFDEICKELEFEKNLSIVDDIRGHEKEFRECAIDSIVKRKNKTGKEYIIVNDFFRYLREKYQIDIAPIGPQMDTLERKMRVYNLLLDNPDMTVEQLSEQLLVPESTIKDDLGGLRDGIHVSDQHLTLGSGKLPIFLALDEMQVKNVLESVDPSIAKSILFQQTPERREDILIHLEPDKEAELRNLLENNETSGSE